MGRPKKVKEVAEDKTAKTKAGQYRAVRALSYKGERVEAGAILDLSEKDLELVNLDYVESLDKEVAKGEVKEEKVEVKGSEIDI